MEDGKWRGRRGYGKEKDPEGLKRGKNLNESKGKEERKKEKKTEKAEPAMGW